MKIKNLHVPGGELEITTYKGIDITFNGSFYFFFDLDGEEWISAELEKAHNKIDSFFIIN